MWCMVACVAWDSCELGKERNECFVLQLFRAHFLTFLCIIQHLILVMLYCSCWVHHNRWVMSNNRKTILLRNFSLFHRKTFSYFLDLWVIQVYIARNPTIMLEKGVINFVALNQCAGQEMQSILYSIPLTPPFSFNLKLRYYRTWKYSSWYSTWYFIGHIKSQYADPFLSTRPWSDCRTLLLNGILEGTQWLLPVHFSTKQILLLATLQLW